ncbi:hypothetical protein WA1_36050 [Scytonema hofmannii PCC 7110]|uniref:Uncharacterized protein n=1 Tax=Scytonema hofmannii PCC 7110 TaxID=128403 RepID=A0A139X1K7_9CYAN|nr:hypothetical protein WA1_36050 [Scytonema hofmannii PCC 7110]
MLVGKINTLKLGENQVNLPKLQADNYNLNQPKIKGARTIPQKLLWSFLLNNSKALAFGFGFESLYRGSSFRLSLHSLVFFAPTYLLVQLLLEN